MVFDSIFQVYSRIPGFAIIVDYLKFVEIFVNFCSLFFFVMVLGKFSPVSDANLVPDSAVCQTCALRNFADFAFNYRQNIPNDELPRKKIKFLVIIFFIPVEKIRI